MKIYSEWIDQSNEATQREIKYPLSAYTHHIQEAMITTAFLLRHTGKRSPADLAVYDFGLGWALWAIAMKACGCNVAGTELSPRRREHARRSGIATIEVGDLPTMRFDFINTEQVFEHLPDPNDLARRLAGSLSPRGVLKISVPYARWLENRPLRIDWTARRYATASPMPVAPLEHLNYYRRPSLDFLARQIGLRSVRVPVLTQWNYAFDWSGPRQIAKNIARPLVRKRFRNYYLFSR